MPLSYCWIIPHRTISITTENNLATYGAIAAVPHRLRAEADGRRGGVPRDSVEHGEVCMRWLKVGAMCVITLAVMRASSWALGWAIIRVARVDGNNHLQRQGDQGTGDPNHCRSVLRSFWNAGSWHPVKVTLSATCLKMLLDLGILAIRSA